LAKKNLDQMKVLNGKDDKYSHLTEEEVKIVDKIVHEKWTWLEEKRVLLASTLRTQQPPVTIAQIRAEKQVNIFIKVLITICVHNYVYTYLFRSLHRHWTVQYYPFSISLK